MEHYEDLFTCKDDVLSQFTVSDEQAKGVEILVAVYRDEDYSGSATVLFEQNGKLFLVEGSRFQAGNAG